ncbi:unnamed protein product [Arctia plantaginis]|uniref:Peptidase S7 domain-containing protein n=1 Tax=Arctia plantaginis TaxID=874455 RepID=A0A8S0ZGP3_ARCPL|nr:unnamed protein product [Arctia plantaginis]CAB3231950.1 unnamed protein product [Arctia plantaginis]
MVSDFNGSSESIIFDDTNVIKVENVVLLDDSFEDTGDYRATLVAKLMRDPNKSVFVDRDKVVIQYSDNLAPVRKFCQYAFDRGYKIMQLHLIADDIFVQNICELFLYNYWSTPHSMLIIVTTSGKIAKSDKTGLRSFRAVDLTETGFEYSHFKGMSGASGSPIVNSKNNVVGIYGSGRWCIDEVPSVGGGLLKLAGLTQIAGVPVRETDMHEHFKRCAAEAFVGKLPKENCYYLLEEPTGSGKTTLFTYELAKLIMGNKSILRLQPNVAAVKNS